MNLSTKGLLTAVVMGLVTFVGLTFVGIWTLIITFPLAIMAGCAIGASHEGK